MAKGTILLSAGGTGGHLFPAEALAHELAARGWNVHLATDKRADRFAGRFPAEAVHVIPSATLSSRNPVVILRTFWRLWQGYRESAKLLQRLRPAAVAGFGGYPTIPPLFAATRRGIPAIIHEQNAVMGRANRALAARVDRIAGGFLRAKGPHAAKIVETGNPVRPEVINAARQAYKPAGSGEAFRLLVFGGSQGARFFSEIVPQAVALLPGAKRSRLLIVQQARPEDEAALRGAYSRIGMTAEISPFFDDLAARMAKAHLVMSRSGASTVSEIAVIGRPAILVPYPHALDHDQAANAEALAAAGGAEVCAQAGLDAAGLARQIGELMDDPGRCEKMAKAAKTKGKPDAARLLADLTEDIASPELASVMKKGARQ